MLFLERNLDSILALCHHFTHHNVVACLQVCVPWGPRLCLASSTGTFQHSAWCAILGLWTDPLLNEYSGALVVSHRGQETGVVQRWLWTLPALVVVISSRVWVPDRQSFLGPYWPNMANIAGLVGTVDPAEGAWRINGVKWQRAEHFHLWAEEFRLWASIRGAELAMPKCFVLCRLFLAENSSFRKTFWPSP